MANESSLHKLKNAVRVVTFYFISYKSKFSLKITFCKLFKCTAKLFTGGLLKVTSLPNNLHAASIAPTYRAFAY